MTSDDSTMTGEVPAGNAADDANAPFAGGEGVFTDFDLAEPIQVALHREGLTTPTPIQNMAIPALLAGEDLIGLAQTGTGKTAAFLLPMMTLLGNSPAVRAGQPPKALILAPTRELANQIATNFSRLSRDMNMRHVTVFGGARYDVQIKGLRRGVDVVIATPGRLIDLLDRGAFDPSGIAHLVLDEADHMLDLGFFEPIKKIVSALPADRQTMLFSATMPTQIEQLGKQFLTDPVRVKAPQTGITADKITQHVTLMPEGEKRDRLCDVLRDDNTGQCLIFVRTKRRADALAKFIQTRGFAVDALHGDMRQSLRQKVLRGFRDGQMQALIATDVAARGIDVAGLSHVVNFDLTDTPESYVHRIGRTGRAGLGGLAVSFCAPDEEARLAAIISMVGARVELFDLDGNRVTDFQPKGGGKRGRPSRSRRGGAGDKQSSARPSQNRSDTRRGDARRGDTRRDDKGRDGKGRDDKRRSDTRRDDTKASPPRSTSRPAAGGDKRAKRKWDDAKTGTNTGTSWSPVPRGEASDDSRPRTASRPAAGSKPRGKPDARPEKRPEKRPDSRPDGKFGAHSGDKPAAKRGGKFADKGKPDWSAKPDQRKAKRDDAPKGDRRDDRAPNEGRSQSGRPAAPKGQFGANPFAKPAAAGEGRPTRKPGAKPGARPGPKPGPRPEGNAGPRPDRKPGKKPYRKPGGNNPLRRK